LQAAARIQAGALTGGSLEALAHELGIGSRQLRRVTKQFLGATPVELAQTQRLLLAKQLLTETCLPVIDVALASGFSSLRRFNALVRSSYGLTPRMMRRKTGRDTAGAPLALMLAYRPPLAWRELLAFLAARAIPGVESVVDDCYMRTVRIGPHTGWVAVRPLSDRAALKVEVALSLLKCLPEVMSRLRHLFDLNARPDVIARSLSSDTQLRTAVRRRPGLRVPGAFDGFEIAARAVLGQQTSVRAATTMAGRWADRFGEPIETPFARLTRTTPTAAVVAGASATQMTKLGLTSRRAAALVELARVADRGAVSLQPDSAPEKAIAALCAIDGIGDWTAQYIAMRALRWPDAFPAGDLVLKRRLGGSERAARAAAEGWRPWRAYGALHTWMMNTD